MRSDATWQVTAGALQQRTRVVAVAAATAVVGRVRATAPARAWRRSLYVRVVASTMLLSALIVGAVGVIIEQRVVGGLVASQRSAALAEATAGLRTLSVAAPTLGRNDEDARERLVEVVRTLSGKGSQAGLFDVLLVPPEGEVAAVSSGPLDSAMVSRALRDSVRDGEGPAFQYVDVPQPSGESGPGLLVGGATDSPSGRVELYYAFPLGETARSVALVERVMLTSGLLLTLLLAGVAALVTHQVVTPVRQARDTAEELAAGDLRVRMGVRGEDDLARLAVSFNEMADTLQSKIDELERLSAVQRAFVSDVSHELRTPLTTVRMATDVLAAAREEFPPDLARAAELLDTEVGRFESLLSDLLEISRHDAKVAELDAEWVDLGELVADLTAGMAALADRQGCDVRVLRPDGAVEAEVDVRRVERIVRNLLGNALEHGAGAPVDVTVGTDGRAVAVVVADRGRGLRPGDAPMLFHRFWRADTSRARTIGGTGLGLSISFEDARLHGGWLQAWGEPGMGARFRLTLPVLAGGHVDASPLPLEPEGWRDGPTQLPAPGPAQARAAVQGAS